jgi:hypothetical protein
MRSPSATIASAWRSRYRFTRSSEALTAAFWKSSISVATSGKMSSQR